MSANKPKMLPSREEITEWLNYNPETGIFTRKKKNNRKQIIGEEVGSRRADGYLVTHINKKRYYLHRIAYFLLTGDQPEMVDHINGNTTDNRAINLRAASCIQNAYNMRKGRRNHSGHKNVYWNSSSKKWNVKMNANKKYYWGGSFSSLDSAIVACEKLRIKLHGEFANHGGE